MIINFLKKHTYKFSIAWALVIFALCSMPGSYIPSISWLEMLSFDKWVHAGVFFILVSLLGFAVKVNQQTTRLFYLYVILSVVYGICLELMQAALFCDRSADWHDVIANSLGCLMASVVLNKFYSLLFK